MINPTPLATSTVPRDLLHTTNSSKIALPASSQTSNANNFFTDDPVSSLSALTITPGKLKDLEADIVKEANELGTLKEAINKSEQLSFRMVQFNQKYKKFTLIFLLLIIVSNSKNIDINKLHFRLKY